MRLAFAFVFAGCIQPTHPEPTPPPYDPGWSGPTGDPLVGCSEDGECGTQICARDRACYPASQIRFAHTVWTVRDADASAASCADFANLRIGFRDSAGASFGFEPVLCKNGEFSVDKLPRKYTVVELGEVASTYPATASIDPVTGEATIDLP